MIAYTCKNRYIDVLSSRERRFRGDVRITRGVSKSDFRVCQQTGSRKQILTQGVNQLRYFTCWTSLSNDVAETHGATACTKKKSRASSLRWKPRFFQVNGKRPEVPTWYLSPGIVRGDVETGRDPMFDPQPLGQTAARSGFRRKGPIEALEPAGPPLPSPSLHHVLLPRRGVKASSAAVFWPRSVFSAPPYSSCGVGGSGFVALATTVRMEMRTILVNLFVTTRFFDGFWECWGSVLRLHLGTGKVHQLRNHFRGKSN